MQRIPSIIKHLQGREDLRFFVPELGKSLRENDSHGRALAVSEYLRVRELDLATGDVVIAHRNPRKEKLLELVSRGKVTLYTWVSDKWHKEELLRGRLYCIPRETPHALCCELDVGHNICALVRIILENTELDVEWEADTMMYPDLPRYHRG